jgi:hypothetical protein
MCLVLCMERIRACGKVPVVERNQCCQVLRVGAARCVWLLVREENILACFGPLQV